MSVFKEHGITEELHRIVEAQGPEFSKAFYVLIMCQDERPLSLIRESSSGDKQGLTDKLLDLAGSKDEYALNALAVLTRTRDVAERFCNSLDLIARLAPVVAPQNPGMAVASVTAPHLAEPVWRIVANTCWVPGVGQRLCERGGLGCVYSYLTLGQESLQCAALQALDGVCSRGTQEDSGRVAAVLFDSGDLPGVMVNLCTAPQTPAVQHAALCFCATLATLYPRFCGGVAEVVGSVDVLLRHATYAGSAGEATDLERQSMERALLVLAALVGAVNLGVVTSGKLIGAFANAIRSTAPGSPARLHAINALGRYSAYIEWNIENHLVSLGAIEALVSAMTLAYPDESYAAGTALYGILKASPGTCGTAAVSAGIIQNVIAFMVAKDVPSQNSSSSSSNNGEARMSYRDLGVHIAACLTSIPAGMGALGSSQQALEVLVDVFSDTPQDQPLREETVAVLLAVFTVPEIAAFDRFMKIAGLEGVFDLFASE